MENIDVHSLKEWLDDDKKLLLLDVREEWEYEHCRIQGSINIPLSVLHNNIGAIESGKDIILICHHGARSFSAGLLLQDSKIDSRLYNLDGGIDAWAEHIDDKLPRY